MKNIKAVEVFRISRKRVLDVLRYYDKEKQKNVLFAKGKGLKSTYTKVVVSFKIWR